ncbi:MAG: competence/damage-inducible protein A [Actinomycetota bacterium]
MRCDVLAVGTELLLGQIIDSNSAWMGGTLAEHGIDSLAQAKVGDNVDRIEAQLRALLADADAVITCGGLGPTHDDLTREAIARVMEAELVRHDDVAERIREMFAARGRTMTANNLRQAMVPEGAVVIEQTRGTAPGLICPVSIDGEAKVVYAVPGVPHEMRDMVHRAIIPDLRERSGETFTIVSRVLRTWGESESGLNERLDDVIEQLESPDTPTLAFLASGWNGLKVRLTAKAPDADAADAQIAKWEAVVRDRIGELVFGTDDDTMESVVLDTLRTHGRSLAVAESVTGGLVGARLTEVAGASDVFRGSIVSYASEVKRDLLAVDEGPVVSESAARQMAHGVRKRLGADVGLSLTGVAGPSEQDGQPVGTLYVGLVGPGFDEVRHALLPGQREQMRQFSVITALGWLRAALNGS